MKKAVTMIIALATLIAVQTSGQKVIAADIQRSLVIGRITGTNLGYPTMFRDTDINQAIPDPMVVQGFVILDDDWERVSRIYLKPDGFFFSEVPSGSLTLARFRKDRPRSYDPINFPILPFVAATGSIINLGTIAVHQEGKPLETALRIGRRATVGEFLYRYRYFRTDDHAPVLGTLKHRESELYDLYFGEGAQNINTLPSKEFDSSEKEFTDHHDKDR
jgi:hypothetical protein